VVDAEDDLVVKPSSQAGTEEAVRRLFDGRRLRLARELRGMTQSALAQLVKDTRKLSAAAISQFERGDARPTVSAIAAMSEALNVPPAFFSRRTSPSGNGAFFRSLRSASVSDQRRARAMAMVVSECAATLERHVQLPKLDVPVARLAPDASESDVEAVAARVRAEWRLDPGPIDDVVRLLERRGVVVARLQTESATIDAFSIPSPDRPVVILGKDKDRRDRSRFDCAHELGHLVMHEDVPEKPSKLIESQAQQFAAAFLMPADDIFEELPRSLQWDAFVELKWKWQTSIQALLRRAKTLRCISDAMYVQGMKTISARRWRDNEPGDLGAPEQPVLLQKAFDVLCENSGRSLSDVLLDEGLPADVLEQVLVANRDRRPKVDL
jgi:Zn-dependent peptidase ImmA (M78 family)/transcriptional regulator with XRE-family HTH domain